MSKSPSSPSRLSSSSSSSSSSTFAKCVVVLMIGYFVVSIKELKSMQGLSGVVNFSPTSTTAASAVSLESAINSATGKLFLGESIRKFPVSERTFAGSNLRSSQAKGRPTRNAVKDSSKKCDKWNVVTTIFAPSEAVKRAASVAGWCSVIVADTKTPSNYKEEIMAAAKNKKHIVHYLSVEDQQSWLKETKDTAVGDFLDAIPYKHFARKNIGYLYAIQHGAKFMFDYDDDNLLPLSKDGKTVIPPFRNSTHVQGVRKVDLSTTAFNHHPLMGATVENSWARGFPLQFIQDKSTQGSDTASPMDLAMESVGVMQFCANGNPDIDAIHRLVHPLPMNFKLKQTEDANTPKPSTHGAVEVPSHALAPYNAQATIHTYKAMWALLLPFTVPGRVSDIWRGYFAEALFRELGISLIFLPAIIEQDRNEHHYLADMQAELDLYFKGGKLLELLRDWKSTSQSVPERMEELWIDLYERGYIELNDVKVAQLWLAALIDIGYKFPTFK